MILGIEHQHIDSVNRKIGELKLKYLNFSNLDEEKKAKKKVRRRFQKKNHLPISLQMNLCKIVFLLPKSTIVRFFFNRLLTFFLLSFPHLNWKNLDI